MIDEKKLLRAVNEYFHKVLMGETSDRPIIIHEEIKAIINQQEKVGEWIPIKYHELTDEEREENGLSHDIVYMLDCRLPDDCQEILITTKTGRVDKDECCIDDGYSLDSGYDFVEDVSAWMPLPEPWKGGAE